MLPIAPRKVQELWVLFPKNPHNRLFLLEIKKKKPHLLPKGKWNTKNGSVALLSKVLVIKYNSFVKTHSLLQSSFLLCGKSSENNFAIHWARHISSVSLNVNVHASQPGTLLPFKIDSGDPGMGSRVYIPNRLPGAGMLVS